MNIKKVDNQLTVQILPDESRSIRHKQSVFQRHWYQLELRENGLGNIYTILTEGQDLEIVQVRDQLNTLPDDKWTTRITNLLAGLVSNLYLVHQGKLFEPYMHPNNFIYSPAHGRILTFYRYDQGLKLIDKAQLTKVYKLLAFMLSSSPVSEYERLDIADIEVDMDDRQYTYFRKLVQEGNVNNLAKYFLSDMDISRLDSYDTIVPDIGVITVTDSQFLATWTSKRKTSTQESSQELAFDLPVSKEDIDLTQTELDEGDPSKPKPPRRKKQGRPEAKKGKPRQSQRPPTSKKRGPATQTAKKRKSKTKSKTKAPQNQSLSKELMGRKLPVKEPDMYYGINQKNKGRKKALRILSLVALVLVVAVLYLLFFIA